MGRLIMKGKLATGKYMLINCMLRTSYCGKLNLKMLYVVHLTTLSVSQIIFSVNGRLTGEWKLETM